jgi:hypothetical protein
LIKPRATITSTEVVSALQAASGPFVTLEKFHSELMALYNVYVPKVKRVTPKA